MKKNRLLLLLLLFASGMLPAQIYFNNPSFEGEPQDATVPVGWLPCAPLTTPDILPGVWGVYGEPADGDTFVGLITRENGTFESITQRLKATLAPGQCYTFSIDLARSPTYNGYSGAVKLRIWGGAHKCEQDQLLLETDFVESPEWETHSLQFEPEQPINYILFEAFYEEGYFSHRGNILLDNLSAIRLCSRA